MTHTGGRHVTGGLGQKQETMPWLSHVCVPGGQRLSDEDFVQTSDGEEIGLREAVVLCSAICETAASMYIDKHVMDNFCN